MRPIWDAGGRRMPGQQRARPHAATRPRSQPSICEIPISARPCPSALHSTDRNRRGCSGRLHHRPTTTGCSIPMDGVISVSWKPAFILHEPPSSILPALRVAHPSGDRLTELSQSQSQSSRRPGNAYQGLSLAHVCPRRWRPSVTHSLRRDTTADGSASSNEACCYSSCQ
jgi:hypothetical protein